jgi:hypothetical protein
MIGIDAMSAIRGEFPHDRMTVFWGEATLFVLNVIRRILPRQGGSIPMLAPRGFRDCTSRPSVVAFNWAGYPSCCMPARLSSTYFLAKTTSCRKTRASKSDFAPAFSLTNGDAVLIFR